MHIKQVIALILASTALFSCQPLPAPSIPTPEVWLIQRTPTLNWLSDNMDSCARQQGKIDIIHTEVPTQDINPALAVFSLRWGPPSALKSAAAVVGFDDLSIIVNPKNALIQLNLEDLRSIYQEARFWKAFKFPGTPLVGEIKPWIYPDGQDTQQVFQQLLNQAPHSNILAGFAPDPPAMREAIAADVNAIGFLPRRWLNSTVRQVELSGANPELIRQPILALYNQQPHDAQRAWLACLQSKISPGK